MIPSKDGLNDKYPWWTALSSEIVVSLASAYSQWVLAEEGRGTKKHREILLFHKCESDLGSGRNGQ